MACVITHAQQPNTTMKSKFWIPVMIIPFAFAACGEKTTTEEASAPEEAAVEAVENAAEAVEEAVEEAVNEVEEAVEAPEEEASVE